MSKIISFSAQIGGEDVRITVKLKELDVVSRDNVTTYGPSTYEDLTDIEFEEIYEE